MTEQSKRSVHDVQLDRLVDGELSPREYRALLAVLDAEPGGWRRCALAFLEAQAWGTELQASCGSSQWAEPVRHDRVNSPRWWKRATSAVVAVAAVFLVAFGLGWLWGGSAPRTNSAIVANQQSGPHPANAPVQRDRTVAVSATPRRATPVTETDLGPWEDITLIADGHTGVPQEIRVPLLPLDGASAMRVLNAETSVPHDVQRALQHLGYEVRRDRRWTPVQSNGRRVIVPLEQVEITPVANRAY